MRVATWAIQDRERAVARAAQRLGRRAGTPPADLEEVHIAIPEGPGTLDPARVQTHTDVVIARALFATLVERDADGEPAPGLATAWQMVEGTRTLRLTMRTDARFSDGTALSAHDVVWSWQRALRTTVGAQDKALSLIHISEPTRPY